PCWGGEAPVTCAADRHTISTEGWPTESGEIGLVFTLTNPPEGIHRYIIDGRATGDAERSILLVHPDGRLRLDFVAGTGSVFGPTLDVGHSYQARLRVAGGQASILLDGVTVIAAEGVLSWAPVARIGHA